MSSSPLISRLKIATERSWLQGRVLGDAEGQGRLAHARARGDHDHVARLEPADDPVQVEEPGGDAGDPAARSPRPR